MVNFFFCTRRKTAWYIPYIESQIIELDINLSLHDETKMWNIYQEYGKGFCQTGTKETDGYEYSKSFDLDFVIVECVHDYKWFIPHKKDWFIFRLGETSGVEYPKLMSFEGINHWSSDSNTYDEVLKIAKKLVSEANAFYIKREQDYREQMAQEQEWEDMEQLGCSPHRYSDEEREFNDMMNEMDAWGNID